MLLLHVCAALLLLMLAECFAAAWVVPSALLAFCALIVQQLQSPDGLCMRLCFISHVVLDWSLETVFLPVWIANAVFSLPSWMCVVSCSVLLLNVCQNRLSGAFEKSSVAHDVIACSDSLCRGALGEPQLAASSFILRSLSSLFFARNQVLKR